MSSEQHAEDAVRLMQELTEIHVRCEEAEKRYKAVQEQLKQLEEEAKNLGIESLDQLDDFIARTEQKARELQQLIEKHIIVAKKILDGQELTDDEKKLVSPD